MHPFIASICILALHVATGRAESLVDMARLQIGKTTSYDPTYRRMAYPGGDVPLTTGVCSDVVVRAFRGLKMDLQKLVHEDMEMAFDQYPHKWGLKRPDSNIDHRRVPNLMTYFQRKGWSVSSNKKADFLPGDIAVWNLGSGITHIGIVSDRSARDGTPLIIHNIGQGAREEDILFAVEIIGHYRPQFVAGQTTAPNKPSPTATP